MRVIPSLLWNPAVAGATTRCTHAGKSHATGEVRRRYGGEFFRAMEIHGARITTRRRVAT
jgi:hypothetical protein